MTSIAAGGRNEPVITTTRAEILGRAITQVLSVVTGEGTRIVDAFVTLEESAIAMGADAIIDVRTTTAGASSPHGAQFWTTVTGTAVRLAPAATPSTGSV